MKAPTPIRPVVYLPTCDMRLANGDWRLAGLMTAGVDVWPNTPQPLPQATGTRGMKAAMIFCVERRWIFRNATQGGIVTYPLHRTRSR